MTSEPLDLKSLRGDSQGRGLSAESQFRVLALFEAAMDSSPEHNIDETAQRFVVDLIAFAPESKTGLSPDDLVWHTWETLISIATRIPSRHYGQEVLAKIISLLGASEEPWKGLPSFGVCLRDNWNHNPTFNPRNEGESMFTFEQWVNLNSFVARLFAAQQGFMNLAIWELRGGLEEVQGGVVSASVAGARVQVACEWIVLAGRRLFRESLLGSLATHEEPGGAQPYRGGSLFSGTKGFNLERWGFWKRRLGELRSGVQEYVLDLVDEAVEWMAKAEREAADNFPLN